MVDLSGHWWIECSDTEFQRIRSDPQFRTVLRLARATNAVRFCQLLLIEERDGDRPGTERLRLNAFLYLSSILFEAIEFAKAASKDLKDIPEFQAHFVPLFRDKKVQELTG